MKEFSELLEAISKLISAFIWPSLLLLILLLFRVEFSQILKGLSELSFKIPGAEGVLKLQLPPEAASRLAAAATQAKLVQSDSEQAQPSRQKPSDAGPQVSATPSSYEIAKTVERNIETAQAAATPRALKNARGAEILWVDDNPENNIYEQQALEAFGIKIIRALSTEEALKQAKSNKFDVIISDMGRPEGDRAGYDFLEELRKLGNMTPYIIYSSIGTPQADIAARSRGAAGATNMPGTLVKLVLNAIQAQ
ncbi:response regulator [Methylobacterium sp. A54F]